jgi:hypothetical protein
MQNVKMNIILILVWVIVIVMSHFIIPPDIRPLSQDYLQDVARSHQLGPQPVRFGFLGWVFMVTVGVWILIGIKTIKGGNK